MTIDGEALRDDQRTMALYRGAISRGFISTSEADRLNYFGAVEHAKATKEEDPGNLLAWIIMGRRWDVITDLDDDRARTRLKRIDRPANGIKPRVQE